MLRHRAQMLANAVSRRAAWVLVPQPLNYRLSDTVSTHVTPRKGGVSVSGVVGVREASGALSSSFALRHHAWMLCAESSADAGAADAESPLGRCCIGARKVSCTQK